MPSSTSSSEKPRAAAWLAQAALATFACVAAASLAIPATLPFDETPVSTMATFNQLVTERYVYEEYKRPIVLVGSSILTNIPPASCRPADVASIYLQGSGAQTGLEAILRSGATPKVVFVETSVGFLGPDEAILKPSFDGAAKPKSLLPALRAYRNWLVMLFRFNMPAQSSSFALPDYSVEEWKRRNADAWDAHSRPVDNETNIAKGFEGFRSRVQALLDRGVRVIFYDPTSPTLANLPQVASWRDKVAAAFPGVEWAPAPQFDVYYRDGLHMEAYSGIPYFDFLMRTAGLDTRTRCVVAPAPAANAAGDPAAQMADLGSAH